MAPCIINVYQQGQYQLSSVYMCIHGAVLTDILMYIAYSTEIFYDLHCNVKPEILFTCIQINIPTFMLTCQCHSLTR